MNKYYIEFLNADGKDRETIVVAANPKEALHKFNMEFGMVEICDFVDITDEDNRFSVVDSLVEEA